MTQVITTSIPDDSILQSCLAAADFYDAYEAPLQDASLTPTEIFLRASRATPPWVGTAMTLRNRIARNLGLKDVGGMKAADDRPAKSYAVGDRLGIFNILGKSDRELLLGIDDRHLDVRVSLLKLQRNDVHSYVVSTVVKVHNRLGHIYMGPVGLIHPLVVKAMMKRALV